jgi:hypothetical protein
MFFEHNKDQKVSTLIYAEWLAILATDIASLLEEPKLTPFTGSLIQY